MTSEYEGGHGGVHTQCTGPDKEWRGERKGPDGRDLAAPLLPVHTWIPDAPRPRETEGVGLLTKTQKERTGGRAKNDQREERGGGENGGRSGEDYGSAFT